MPTSIAHAMLRIIAIAVCLAAPTTAIAGLTSPEIGWQAELSMLFHDVSGVVTIVDEDTIRIDDFTYDGGASFVYFYVGADDTDAAFTNGLRVGDLLSGTAYDGTQGPLFADLPLGESFEGQHAVSVWCERFTANFGSGTFAAPVPEPAAAVLLGIFLIGFASRKLKRCGLVAG